MDSSDDYRGLVEVVVVDDEWMQVTQWLVWFLL